MRWSWPDYLATDEHAADEVDTWMREIHAAEVEAERQRKRKSRQR